MIKLTEAARNRLDRYLSDLRSSLAGCPNVDSVDVETDVLQHIETSLATAAPPVDVPALADVLQRLGSPSQWIPKDELSWMRRQVMRVREHLHSGPEDFRLAYVTITLLGVAGLLLAVAPPVPSLVCIALSFFFSRSALAMAPNPAELGPRRWLLYPTLVIVYVSLIVGLMTWTLPAVACWATETRLEAIDLPAGPVPIWVFATYLAVAGTSLWWLLIGFFSWRRPPLVRNVFYPFADGFQGRHAFWFSVISLLIFAAAAVVGTLAMFGWRPW